CPAECHPRRRNGWSEKCLALCDSESAGDRLYLVQLSPRPAEPCFARADAWRFFFSAREPPNCRRQSDCSCCGHQSFSGNCNRLSTLPALLDSSSQPCRDACIFSSPSTGAIPRL